MLFGFCSSYLDLTYTSANVYFVNESGTFACLSLHLNDPFLRLRLLLFVLDSDINFCVKKVVMIRTDYRFVYCHTGVIKYSLHMSWVKWSAYLSVLSWPAGYYCLLKILIFTLTLFHVKSLWDDLVLRHGKVQESVLHMVFNCCKVHGSWHYLRRRWCVFLRRYHYRGVVQELVLASSVIIKQAMRPLLSISRAFRFHSVKLCPLFFLIFWSYNRAICSCTWAI